MKSEQTKQKKRSNSTLIVFRLNCGIQDAKTAYTTRATKHEREDTPLQNQKNKSKHIRSVSAIIEGFWVFVFPSFVGS